ncbi:putative metalloendopeptidase [Clavispora lusitaniae]|uniref:Metalloendopeptidase n=1 Tax=Clavispora lusitaniae TaxID=36911 RepID=A0AA91PVT6_CLALS|nr:putative metalloendopeptidase [Clavispora lusitaniae]
MIEFNYRNGEIVSSPTVIVSGTSSKTDHGVIEFINNENSVFPPQFFEVNNGCFKALLHVSPGEPNKFKVTIWDKARLNAGGFLENGRKAADQSELTLFFNPLPENKPLHICVILGKDSDGSYDMPNYKLQQGQLANLNTAIQRLKVAARMMQAYTQDEFHNVGLSNRTFQVVEEMQNFQGVFGYSLQSKIPHAEAKIHVIRSPKTVKELRDPNYAQQNPKAKESGWLFNHAIDLIQKQDFYQPYKDTDTAIQCAVMYLDSHWDSNTIVTHAALGGGTGEVKLAIFGSHGLHSFPLTFPQITPSFLDDTKLSKKEVANDASQCSTSWECLNICMGAFMHEIGHSFGSPHQTDGVMLRDYLWWNRSFMTREAYCHRDKKQGCCINRNGCWPKTCHWNIRDLIRYLYHDSFSIPVDKNDDTFPKIQASTFMPNKSYPNQEAPSSYIVASGVLTVRSIPGIYMIELCGEDLARFHIPFFPKSYGGPGVQHEITLDYKDLSCKFKQSWDRAGDEFDVRVLSVSGDLYIKNFKKSSQISSDTVIKSDFNLGRGIIEGYKSDLLGSAKGDMKFIGFDVMRITNIRVYHGFALDGISIFISNNGHHAPPVPKRDYLAKVMGKLSIDPPKSHDSGGTTQKVTLGNEKPHYTEFTLQPGEFITKMSFRTGQWVDAICIETNTGRSSGMLGNTNGGHVSVFEPPQSSRMVGMYGYTGSWMDGVGIVYAKV